MSEANGSSGGDRTADPRGMIRLLLLLTPLLLAAAPEGLVVRPSPYDFATLVDRTKDAVAAGGLVVVGEASASRVASGRGVSIPGDAVLMVFNNVFAVRMLAASQAAGVEAPLHLHIMQTQDGHAAVGYRLPSSVFRPYGSPALDALAAELDGVFAGIAAAAVRP